MMKSLLNKLSHTSLIIFWVTILVGGFVFVGVKGIAGIGGIIFLSTFTIFTLYVMNYLLSEGRK
jgi:hypothetical protein